MPDLFISYSRDDSLAMGVIRDNLRKLGFNLWIDIEHLKPGTPQWERAIKAAIRKVDGIIVICSPSAEQSEWVNREISIAKAAGAPIIAVLVRGEELLDSIPAGIFGDQFCDMRGRFDPTRGFQELIERLAATFGVETPEYELRQGGHGIPSVQVINVYGHVEGNVIAIGRDVSGELNVAARDVNIETVPTPPVRAQTAPEPVIEISKTISVKPPTRNIKWTPIAIVGGIIASGLLIGGLALGGVFGKGNPASSATEPSSATQPIDATVALALPIDTPTLTLQPADAPPPSETPQPGFAPVTRNAEWTPIIQLFDGVAMARVPAGCFRMGSDDGESDEQPVHEVCFDAPFWIDNAEVTNVQYGSEGIFKGADRPREFVFWNEARDYCERRGARLPTEAEWEYAARGPDNLIYPWGDSFVADRVVYVGNSNSQTARVGSRPVISGSWVGAFDLSGNVAEWVADLYGPYSSGRQVNPSGPSSGDYYVARGGDYNFPDLSYLRATRRNRVTPGFKYLNIGFRCARSD